MSDTLESRLHLALGRVQSRTAGPDAAATLQAPNAERNHAAHDHNHDTHWANVCALIEQGARRANQHFVGLSECCEFYDISPCYTESLQTGGSNCNPVAYQFRIDGQPIGEPLLVERTQDDQVIASLGRPRPSYPEIAVEKVDFGWRPALLHGFDAGSAADLLVRYASHVLKGSSLRRAFPTPPVERS
jgi:hypothetical protein